MKIVEAGWNQNCQVFFGTPCILKKNVIELTVLPPTKLPLAPGRLPGVCRKAE